MLALPSVGATENLMLAACAAEGTTRVLNAAREPEIVDLQAFLRACGARVTGAGTSTVTVEGVVAACDVVLKATNEVSTTASASTTDKILFIFLSFPPHKA